jgi:invasion protein IalB
MVRFYSVWRCCAVFLVLGQFAAAQSSSVDPDEQVFTDWRVLCQPSGETSTCQMLQSASASEDGPTVFLLSISPGEDAGTSYAVVTVPVGVYLAPGIEIRVDRRRPFKVLYEICDLSGCHAGFKLSGSVLNAFRQGVDAKVRVWTAKTQAVEFPVSLRGFSAANRYYQEKISS